MFGWGEKKGEERREGDRNVLNFSIFQVSFPLLLSSSSVPNI
jgi:hypothetical protein